MMCYSLEWLGLIKTLLSASAYVTQTNQFQLQIAHL